MLAGAMVEPGPREGALPTMRKVIEQLSASINRINFAGLAKRNPFQQIHPPLA
jgi:hypothetical protein